MDKLFFAIDSLLFLTSFSEEAICWRKHGSDFTDVNKHYVSTTTFCVLNPRVTAWSQCSASDEPAAAERTHLLDLAVDV